MKRSVFFLHKIAMIAFVAMNPPPSRLNGLLFAEDRYTLKETQLHDGISTRPSQHRVSLVYDTCTTPFQSFGLLSR